MVKNILSIISFFTIVLCLWWSFYGSSPRPELEGSISPEKFSTSRAFSHVENIARNPHPVGTAAHAQVRNYLVQQLEDLGLLVETQEGLSVNEMGIVTRPQNILARIKGSGNGKSLLLMSHYDSAMHSSYGASDAGSGLAVILEGLRAYLASGVRPVNDIIILFSDAEELGLNGAALFVEEHPWAKNVGVALNFEARGSGGNSFMFLEPTSGNQKLLRHFAAAGVDYPVTNSLVYSIYKMLPNDTDLTVLRERGNINGFNFAFIDDHYDYHTALDNPQRLDMNSLAHHGSYLMPLLRYFSRASIEDLSSEKERVFFNFPVIGMISYPYSMIWVSLITTGIFFIVILFFGLLRKKIGLRGILKGVLPMALSLFLCGLLAWGLWEFLLVLYPQYLEMEHGFTYNGYWYITAVIFLTLGICFYIYDHFQKGISSAELLISPLLFWFALCVFCGFYLQGASYFVIPLFLGLVQLIILLMRFQWAVLPLTLLSLPSLFILVIFIVMFPVAMGLGMLFLTAILTVLLFMLCWPVFSQYSAKRILRFLCFLSFFAFFVIAHFKSDFSEDRPKPNSLVYFKDLDRGLATWNTYDIIPDSYTAAYINDTSAVRTNQTVLASKYNSGFLRTSLAPLITVPGASVEIGTLPSRAEGLLQYEVKIAPNRNIARLDLYTDISIDFEEFLINGKKAPLLEPGMGKDGLHIFRNRWSERLLTYYPVSRDTLRLNLTLESGVHPEFSLYEASYNIHEESQLDVPRRTKGMIPRPFVVNDAIMTKKTFILK